MTIGDANVGRIENRRATERRARACYVFGFTILEFIYLARLYLELSARPNCFNPIRLRPQKNIADNATVERLSNAIAGNDINVICAHVEIDVIPRACVRIHPTNY